jgi:hypothetical protein
MLDHNLKVIGKIPLMLSSIMITVLLIAPSCSSGTDGDLDAYCDVISTNLDLGKPDTNLPIDQLDILISLAPSEVKKIATEIRNISADVAEITQLDQLFAATFDPEAIEAQNSFQLYNSQNCDINAAVVEDLVSATQTETQTELNQFLTTNYDETNWNSTTNVEVIFNGIKTVGIKGTLPLGSGFREAESLCQALSLWLYAVKELEGTISIQVGDNPVLERSSEKLICSTEEIELTD